MNMDEHPEDGFDKLQFLISTAVFPPETFPNLIVLYLKYDLLPQAADVIAENPDIGTAPPYECLPLQLGHTAVFKLVYQLFGVSSN